MKDSNNQYRNSARSSVRLFLSDKDNFWLASIPEGTSQENLLIFSGQQAYRPRNADYVCTLRPCITSCNDKLSNLLSLMNRLIDHMMNFWFSAPPNNARGITRLITLSTNAETSPTDEACSVEDTFVRFVSVLGPPVDAAGFGSVKRLSWAGLKNSTPMQTNYGDAQMWDSNIWGECGMDIVIAISVIVRLKWWLIPATS